MSRSFLNIRRVRDYLLTLSLSALTVGALTSDLMFSAQARPGQLLVTEVSNIVGPVNASIAYGKHFTEEGIVPADIKGTYWRPEVGEVLPTVYSPGSPFYPVHDQFWHRHALFLTTTGSLLVLGIVEAAARSFCRYRTSTA